jgi:hypothetical protein
MSEAACSLRRRRTISLRALMFLILVATLWMSWRVNRAHTQAHAVTRIKEAGGRILYDYQFDGTIPYKLDASPSAPAWLRRMIGDEYFQEVTAVSLGDQTTDDQLVWLAEFDQLIKVDFSEVDNDAESGFGCLEGLKNLRMIGISGGGITDAGLAHLASLRHLETLYLFDARAITDAGMAHLASLRHLETLYLFDARAITDAGMAHVGKMSTLRNLCLASNTAITDEGVAQIAKLRQLQELHLSGCDITDSALVYLKDLKSLHKLSLSADRNITDAGLANLASLTELRELNLSKTDTSDSGLRHLRGLRKLGKVYLYHTWVTDGEAAAAHTDNPGLTISREEPLFP